MAIGEKDTVLIPLKWNFYIVALSFVVGMVGSYTTTYMLYMLDRSRERKQRIIWLCIACMTFGGGTVWALHFTGMMALDIGFTVTYDPLITFASFLVATAGAIIAFTMKYNNILEVVGTPDVESPEDVPLLQVSRGDGNSSEVGLLESLVPKSWFMVLAGFFQGIAIFGMHYSGMKGMLINNVHMHLDHTWMFVSFLPAWFFGVFALNILPRILQWKKQLTFCLFNTTGVFALHYIGMYAAEFRRDVDVSPPDRSQCFQSNIPFVIVVIVSVCCFTVFTVAAQDISRQRDNLMDAIRTKRYIDALKMEKEVLEKENKEKTEFMAIASHEMRTPLHAIAGFAELLSQSTLTKEQDENLQLVRQSVKVLEFVVDNVLNYTRLLSKTIVTDEKWCSLPDVIYDVMVGLSIIIETDIVVMFVNENRVFTNEKCDVNLVLQVVQNLVSNAYKFTNNGLVLVSVKNSSGICKIVVQDTGVGIAPERLEKIFLPFSQLDRTLSRRYTGTGLGLAISDHVAKLLHGTISVSSMLERGSCFTFEFPLEYTEDGPICEQSFSGYYRINGPRDIFHERLSEQLGRFGLFEEPVPYINGHSLRILWNRKEKGSHELIMSMNSQSKTIYIKKVINTQRIFRYIYEFSQQVNENDTRIIDAPVNDGKISPLQKTDISDTSTNKLTNSSPLILVAEDNTVNQTLVKKQLTKLGYRVNVVSNGQECLDVIARDGFDKYQCILMDCQMPIMDGFEATRQLRRLNTTIPIIALTANVSDLSREESENVGMNAFLSKPLKIKELQEALEKYGNKHSYQ